MRSLCDLRSPHHLGCPFHLPRGSLRPHPPPPGICPRPLPTRCFGACGQPVPRASGLRPAAVLWALLLEWMAPVPAPTGSTCPASWAPSVGAALAPLPPGRLPLASLPAWPWGQGMAVQASPFLFLVQVLPQPHDSEAVSRLPVWHPVCPLLSPGTPAPPLFRVRQAPSCCLTAPWPRRDWPSHQCPLLRPVLAAAPALPLFPELPSSSSGPAQAPCPRPLPRPPRPRHTGQDSRSSSQGQRDGLAQGRRGRLPLPGAVRSRGCGDGHVVSLIEGPPAACGCSRTSPPERDQEMPNLDPGLAQGQGLAERPSVASRSSPSSVCAPSGDTSHLWPPWGHKARAAVGTPALGDKRAPGWEGPAS